jgi:hypothetical protein
MDPLSAAQATPIKMNYAAAQEHVPRAERNNRVIQERVRATYHRLPFTHLPRIMVKFFSYGINQEVELLSKQERRL